MQQNIEQLQTPTMGQAQQAFSKPCLVKLISKDTHIVFSISALDSIETLIKENSAFYKSPKI